MSYVAVDRDIWTSTVLKQGPVVVSTWLLLMADADRYGITRATPSSIASVLRVDDDLVDDAFETLMSPDRSSRNKDAKGARLIKQDDGAYLLVSFDKYKQKASKKGAVERQGRYEKRLREARTTNGGDLETLPPKDIEAIRAAQASEYEADVESGKINPDRFEETHEVFGSDHGFQVEKQEGKRRPKAKPVAYEMCVAPDCKKRVSIGRKMCVDHCQVPPTLKTTAPSVPACARADCDNYILHEGAHHCGEHIVEGSPE